MSDDADLTKGTLVRVTGEDFFSLCAGEIGIVTSQRVLKAGDLYEILVDGKIFLVRPDQVSVLVKNER